ncbi:hypothetical protein FQB35_10575 [Crassaminicella thermophila]|uniref:Uncharacterized protein n=1 Tax=Crassaminicella thermophila TaxID=2599308 RepID=A0A5C0SEJ3_CRATE|nr:hypothetical protein [Crassaminicella thermophila]QEK11672.1 hypothetical protein FQB35_04460 [Crassaminicella thermophila]QEK12741.1 hypothetical protein FQB35_10575 [Crassaminicella thermophila]
MPDYFWEWYKNKGYNRLLDKEICFRNKTFLIGCCIEYLTEKGQKINNLQGQNNLDEILEYLTLGVAWTK